MGIVRLFLALVVVMNHVGYSGQLGPFGDSHSAVQVFFVISGFLISYVLNRDRAYSSAWRFFANRALRIFPVYYTVAIPALIITALFTSKIDQYLALNGPAKALLAISNLAIFGQD